MKGFKTSAKSDCFCNKDSGLCRLVQCNKGHVTLLLERVVVVGEGGSVIQNR